MRKVELNMKENHKYKIIKKLVDTNGNKLAASKKLQCSIKHINRLIRTYKSEGKLGFIHGNIGRKPAHTVPESTKKLIASLYKTKYYGANFAHFKELLEEFESIKVSETVVRTVIMKENIVSPKARRKTKKHMKKFLEDKLESSKLTLREKTQVIQSIIDIEDAHPRRPRCKYFGEMLQMDASVFNWFGDHNTQLHIAVDDSTGAIVGAYFDFQETLKGYYNILNQILVTHGIPSKLLTDKRTVFEYKKSNSRDVEKDTFTQFGYACNQLGVEIQTSSIPQAKGRVERMFQTLQSRLPIEMHLAGVTDIKHANEFLNSYIKKFNAKFSLPINHSKSVFETQPPEEKINLILAILAKRKVDSGHCIRIDNKYFKTVDTNNNAVYHCKGTSALVIKAFDGNLYATINESVYALTEVPKHQTMSKNFDIATCETKERKKWIPPMSHPLKHASFQNYLNKQPHIKGKDA